MIGTCFSQPNTPSSRMGCSQVPQNVVTCIYQTQLCNSPTYLTLSWSRTLFSHSLTIHAADIFSITISLNPSTFSFFRTPHCSKSILHHHHFQKIKLLWNLNQAEFIQNSAEPESCFYLAISYNGKLQFFLGDLLHDLTRRHTKLDDATTTTTTHQSQVLLSRREHVFGSKRSYISRAVFMGSKHEIEIECDGGVLRVKVDGQTRLVVKRLAWKFRGYEKIFIDGIQVEFYWDVLSWVVNSNNDNNGNNGHGVFVFQVGDGTVWPEMVGVEKRLMRKRLSSDCSVMQWAEESSDCGRTSSSSSTRSCGSNAAGGFSLLLYAWSLGL
ncbi:uncharacterized protein LOC133286977 [Gastrolobium bilobum]|uniref:uncharacterized protein LOC133286977 n=1 Tax=Gastrolobium bilobum TaxID=150636 RepID=UPI002AB1A9BC|nr:uncharacterized protein LOC133286977 [Gastrolobium bilobum]